MIPLARKVYTYLGVAALTNAVNRVAKTNVLITDALLNTGLPGDPTRDETIDFINGLDPSGQPRNEMGDPMNSQPVSVIYGPPSGSPPNEVDNARVYFATNDGYLHSIDTNDGSEEWAFLPPEFLSDQAELFTDDSTAAKRYGIDGNLRVQTFGDSDGIVEPADGEKVYLFFGMRRGGDVYYGLDITYPDAPTVLWRRDGVSLPGMGQSWATPTPTRITVQGATQNAEKMALVIGGGYDPSQDNTAASTDTIGNSIYIIDSASGNLLWRGSGNAGASKNFSAMQYAIPADVKVVDLNGDRFADRMYAADMGGQVWKFDIVNGQPAASLVNGGVFAQLGSAPLASPTVQETRRFYYPPDIAAVNNDDFNFIHVGIGSGHRAHPNATVNEDRYYALRDYAAFTSQTQAQYDVFTPITDAALVDVTDDIAAVVPQGSPGWKFELRIGGFRGEKVLAEARTFDDQVFFNTYTPNAGSGSGCIPALGLRRQYILSLFTGGPVTNLDGPVTDPLDEDDRFIESDGAPPPRTEFIFLEDPNCVGETCVDRCAGLECGLENFNTNPIRTFWSQESVD
jgi:type IV pilus assembly protein PilY1